MKGLELFKKIEKDFDEGRFPLLGKPIADVLLENYRRVVEKELQNKSIVSTEVLERLDAHRKIKPVKCWGFYDRDATKTNNMVDYNLATCNDCDSKSNCFVKRWLEEFDRLMDEVKT